MICLFVIYVCFLFICLSFMSVCHHMSLYALAVFNCRPCACACRLLDCEFQVLLEGESRSQGMEAMKFP